MLGWLGRGVWLGCTLQWVVVVVVVVVVLVTEGTARLCPILSAGCAGGKPRPARGGQDGTVCVVMCV